MLIHGSDYQGERCYGEIISEEDALQEILKSGNMELLETKKFRQLKELAIKEGIFDSEEEDDEE